MRKRYKCFVCGRLYDSEARAIKCHDAPVQSIDEDETRRRPRFLGN
jgi:rubredoxin